ncbi:MAG: hypothetical protein CMP62_06050 [Flavobacteriales bacterium]|nr:hypothetical protein [Flavobacteriales bacterium]
MTVVRKLGKGCVTTVRSTGKQSGAMVALMGELGEKLRSSLPIREIISPNTTQILASDICNREFKSGQKQTAFRRISNSFVLKFFCKMAFIQDNSNERLASGKARFPGFMTPLALLCFIGEVVGQRVRRIAPTR